MLPYPVKFALSVLGFDAVPKMKELRENFLKLCLERHPDKGGSDDSFKVLLEAKETLSKYIQNNVPEDDSDEEEVFARQLFKHFNIIEVNKSSVTISYPTQYCEAYEQCLERNYGQPDDKSKSNNGKKNKVSDQVFITNYINNKKMKYNACTRNKGMFYISSEGSTRYIPSCSYEERCYINQ